MPKTQTKNPHPIIKILSDLNLLPEKGEDVDAKSYKRALMTGVNLIESSSKDKKGDERSRMLREELIRVRKERDTEPPKEINVKEKKSTIKGAKLLPGTTFRPDDVKPADVDKNQGDTPSLMPDRLDSIAKTVDSIALLLRRQFKVEKKQQRDSRIQQDKTNKGDREDDLEKKPKDKKTGGLPKAIAKPALNFFEKIKKFFLNIVIGSGVMALFDWIKNPANAEKITQFKDFLINNAGVILGGLAALAALPIILTVVSVVKGILAGLALLGPLLPLLPWILGGLLIGAVAWWISKKLFGGEATGRARTWVERKENEERLRAAGILTATEKRLEIKDDKTGQLMSAPMFGDNSITGREAIAERRENKNQRVKLNLLDPDHAAWYVKNYSQEELDAKLAAHKSFRDTKAALKDTAKDMEKEINEVKAKYKKLINDNDSLPFKEKRKANEKLKKERAAEIKAIKEKTGQKAIQIGDNVTGDTEIDIDTNDNSAVIDNNVKPDTNVPGPSTKKKGDNVILDGGSGKQDSSGVGGSGTGGSSDTPKIGSQDPNNISTILTGSIYNMGSA